MESQPTTPTPHEQLRVEFNRWASEGRGQGMESEHLAIAQGMLARMRLGAAEAVLDVGCGTGWLLRLLAERIPRGRFVGVDLADQMVAQARQAVGDEARFTFAVASVERLPFPEASFDRVVSIESAYYWPDPAAGLREIARVLRPGGSAWILINYYRDNPHCHQWGPLLPPTHLLSAEQWAERFRQAGLVDVRYERIPDPTPVPEVYQGRWFRDAEQLRAFRAFGALLVRGEKPTATPH